MVALKGEEDSGAVGRWDACRINSMMLCAVYIYCMASGSGSVSVVPVEKLVALHLFLCPDSRLDIFCWTYQTPLTCRNEVAGISSCTVSRRQPQCPSDPCLQPIHTV